MIYVQDGAAWRRYPEDPPLLPDSVEMSPLANGKVRLKYWEGAPVEFAFFVSGRDIRGRSLQAMRT